MNLYKFIIESNRLEGLTAPPTPREFHAYERFLARSYILVEDLVALVSVIQPNAQLRDIEGLNVRVGSHHPPPGGPRIRRELEDLLLSADSPFERHVAYEYLHPFTDGNGRSGRALWLYDMSCAAPGGFLQHWYFQTLAAAPAAA